MPTTLGMPTQETQDEITVSGTPFYSSVAGAVIGEVDDLVKGDSQRIIINGDDGYEYTMSGFYWLAVKGERVVPGQLLGFAQGQISVMKRHHDLAYNMGLDYDELSGVYVTLTTIDYRPQPLAKAMTLHK